MIPKNLSPAALLLVAALAAPSAHAKDAPATKAGSIVVPVSNLQNAGKGQLMVLLYKKVKRVEVNDVAYYKRLIRTVEGPKMSITFQDVPFGEYAVAVMHDMDKDMRMDANWLGIPGEDLGVSNNAKGGPLGGPKWNAAKFPHKTPESRVAPIKMWQVYD